MLLLDIVEQVFWFDKVVTFEALPLILSVLAWKRKNILKMHYFARFQSVMDFRFEVGPQAYLMPPGFSSL